MAASKPTVAIIGGGISGVVLTIALLRRGIDVKLYEQAHAFGTYEGTLRGGDIGIDSLSRRNRRRRRVQS